MALDDLDGFSRGREIEIAELTASVARWASTNEAIRAVALVGPRALGAASAPLGLSLLVVTTKARSLVAREDWNETFGRAAVYQRRRLGATVQCVLVRPSGLRIAVGVVEPSWAQVDPLEDEAARVVRAGLRVLYDPDRLLATLGAAVLESKGRASSLAAIAAPDFLWVR